MKGKKFYNRLVFITLVFPMLGLMIYFFASANSGVEVLINAPHIYIEELEGLEEDYDFIIDQEDRIQIFLYGEDQIKKISFVGNSIRYNEVNVSGRLTLENPSILFIQGRFYEIDEENLLQKLDTTAMLKESLFETSFSIGMTIFLLIGAVGVISLIIFKKMELYKRYMRASVLISSFTITIIFLLLASITTQIFMIFGVFTVSWLLYYIEWMIFRKAHGMSLSEYVPEKVVVVNG